jgi:hypothetical protein
MNHKRIYQYVDPSADDSDGGDTRWIAADKAAST